MWRRISRAVDGEAFRSGCCQQVIGASDVTSPLSAMSHGLAAHAGGAVAVFGASGVPACGEFSTAKPTSIPMVTTATAVARWRRVQDREGNSRGVRFGLGAA